MLNHRLYLGTHVVYIATLLMSVWCMEFNCFPRGSLQQIGKKQLWCKLWREKEKSTGIQLGIELGTFRLPVGRFYHWIHGAEASLQYNSLEASAGSSCLSPLDTLPSLVNGGPRRWMGLRAWGGPWLSVQAPCLSRYRYSHYPPSQPPAQLSPDALLLALQQASNADIQTNAVPVQSIHPRPATPSTGGSPFKT